MEDLNKTKLGSFKVKLFAIKAVKDEDLLSKLLANLLSKEGNIRFNSLQILLSLSEHHPEKIYPYWNYFEILLDSDNLYHQYSAIEILSHLAKVDDQGKLEKSFENLFGLIEGDNGMLASNLVSFAGKFALARPELQDKITDRLLKIDSLHQGKQKDSVKASAIDAFSEYFANSNKKEEILKFVKDQVQSGSPKNKEKAETFLSKWGK